MNDENHFCHISVKGSASSGAILWGGYLFFLALLAGWGVRFVWVSQELVELLSVVYPGYVVGFGGAFLGLFYGLTCGAVCGGLIAWFHNRFCGA